MTNKECIEHIKHNLDLQKSMLSMCVTDEARNIHRECIEMYQLEIEALEKQIQKTPINGIYCPECGWVTVGRWHKYDYCPHCGQAIDWREMMEENES